MTPDPLTVTIGMGVTEAIEAMQARGVRRAAGDVPLVGGKTASLGEMHRTLWPLYVKIRIARGAVPR